MWTRAEIKSNAKDFLRGHYWTSFWVALVIFLAGGNDNLFLRQGSSSRPAGGEQTGIQIDVGDLLIGPSSEVSTWWLDWFGVPRVIPVALGLVLMILIVMIAFTLFVGAPLSVGGKTYFLEGIRGDVRPSNLVRVFSSSGYLRVVITMFLRGLYTFLWTLLLIIPGIVKHYAYRMVPYILAEEQDLDAAGAIRKSMDLTRGEKWNMFVLDLSFIGWYLLGALMLGIGVLFVHPYYEATYARLYHILNTRGNLTDDAVMDAQV